MGGFNKNYQELNIMKIIGRSSEFKMLDECYQKSESTLIAIYGRRRVGKSYLIEEWIKSKNTDSMIIEGLEKQSKSDQIQLCKNKIVNKIDRPALGDVEYKSWLSILDLLSFYIKTDIKNKNKKKVIFLDEFQWLAGEKSELVSYIKMFWDQEWKKYNIMLILCGSIASFMVNKVIRSKALYGRINLEIKVSPFEIKDNFELIKPKRSIEEICQYYFVFGGIPKYINEINPKQSFEKNINRICFSKSGIMTEEFEKIFYQQFKSASVYIKIIRLLSQGAKSFNDISKALNYPSGGSLKRYVENLYLADFIGSYYPFHKSETTKEKKYYLSDEFSRFYIKYMEKNKSIIHKNEGRDLFNRICKSTWNQWTGIAFEQMAYKHAMTIAKLAHFEDEVKEIGKFFPSEKFPVQLDLVYDRFNKIVTIFEIKNSVKIDVEIVNEMENKINLIKNHVAFKGKTIEKGLFYSGELNPKVKKLNYFHHLLKFEDLVKS